MTDPTTVCHDDSAEHPVCMRLDPESESRVYSLLCKGIKINVTWFEVFFKTKNVD